MPEQPDLTFFCELTGKELENLFEDTSIIKKIKQLNANVSMGLLDFSESRARIVKKLTKSGIPVTAWLLLPKHEGYWTSLDTVPATYRCYGNFKRWTQEYDLQWAAVGLDIEPHLERAGLFTSAWKTHLPDLIKRIFKVKYYRKSLVELQCLVNQIRMDGFPVETYNLPFVVEERTGSSEILSRILGTPSLDADREVLMLYSSFFDKNGDAILYSYAQKAQGIGLGSAGGGVILENGQPLRSLRWIDLRRDLLIANHFSKSIYIFSLEGCIQNGYLDKLLEMDWNAKIRLPIQTSRKISFLRRVAAGFLWVFTRPMQVGAFILTLVVLFKRKEQK